MMMFRGFWGLSCHTSNNIYYTIEGFENIDAIWANHSLVSFFLDIQLIADAAPFTPYSVRHNWKTVNTCNLRYRVFRSLSHWKFEFCILKFKSRYYFAI